MRKRRARIACGRFPEFEGLGAHKQKLGLLGGSNATVVLHNINPNPTHTQTKTLGMLDIRFVRVEWRQCLQDVAMQDGDSLMAMAKELSDAEAPGGDEKRSAAHAACHLAVRRPLGCDKRLVAWVELVLGFAKTCANAGSVVPA